MSDEIRINRAQQQPAVSPKPEMPHSMEITSKTTGASKTPWVILAVIVIVLAGFGILFREKLFGSKNGSAMTSSGSGSSGYQAVFLTNGQVYFGKISDANSDYPVLRDIYYLQVVQPPLQGTPTQAQPAQAQAQPQISLVKLGNELHGPVDEMHISRTQVLFYEDLKSDGQVVKAIQSYKANPSGQTAPVK
jgi:hypothetical protein